MGRFEEEGVRLKGVDTTSEEAEGTDWGTENGGWRLDGAGSRLVDLADTSKWDSWMASPDGLGPSDWMTEGLKRFPLLGGVEWMGFSCRTKEFTE